MSNSKLPVKSFFQNEAVKGKFEELLGKKSAGFIASILQVVNGSTQLQSADPNTIFGAAATAAILDLPIVPSLGYAYIVPYKGQAQFQIGWKGLVQLAQRSGQYLRINVVDVHVNQFKGFNALTEELEADFSVDGKGEIVGYCAYFKLLNGFEKTVYWSKEKVTAHAMKYSQAYKSDRGVTPWKDKDQYHEMAKKTVLKNSLSKWGPLSIEMQKAVIFDQGVVEDVNHEVVTYPDNQPETTDHEFERAKLLIETAESSEQLEKAIASMGEDVLLKMEYEIFEAREKHSTNEGAK